jgi:NodT family efflux transporter outer membrane factor (OMF) lipoprotein
MRITALILICTLLAGCVMGPKYTPPAVPPPPAFKEALPSAYSGALPGAWQPATPQDAAIKGKWWEIFNEPELNALEDQLDIDNQNIAQYFQNFMAARALVSEARAGLFPTVTANPSIGRTGTAASASNSKLSTTGTSTTTSSTASSSSTSGTSISLPIDASWEPDLWGRVRNGIRQAQYAAQVSAADLENERLTEQASLAEFFFELRGQDALQDVNNRIVQAERATLDITLALVETGIYPPAAAAQAEVSLADAQASSIGLATSRAIYEHAIAMLIGKPASDFSLPVKSLATALPPIPVGVPSELLQRRPDIAAAERNMAAANAQIGVEQAAFYPTVSLTGGAGLEGSSLKTLFSLPGLFWSLGSSATQILFDAGLRKATVAQYTAQYDAEVAAYKQSILTAFQQVEDYIATLRVVSQQIDLQATAVKAAQTYLDLETSRYDTGLDPYLDVISAQLSVLSGQQTVVTLRVNEMASAVALIQSLGGGWNASQLPAPAGITTDGAVKQVKDTP